MEIKTAITNGINISRNTNRTAVIAMVANTSVAMFVVFRSVFIAQITEHWAAVGALHNFDAFQRRTI